jgi:hypothetical protein
MTGCAQSVESVEPYPNLSSQLRQYSSVRRKEGELGYVDLKKSKTRCSGTSCQGLILVHFSARRKRFLWDRGCSQGLFRDCFAGV